MYEARQNKEKVSRTISNGFIKNNKSEAELITLQKMKAYDETPQAVDPRHFSTEDLKKSIDTCSNDKTAIPAFLKEEIIGGLQDELNIRHQEMQYHGGGDSGHQHYFKIVKNYVDKMKALPSYEGFNPDRLDKNTIQL